VAREKNNLKKEEVVKNKEESKEVKERKAVVKEKNSFLINMFK